MDTSSYSPTPRFPVTFRVGHSGFGLGIGVGVGVGFGSPVDLRALPVVGPGLASGIGQASSALSGIQLKARSLLGALPPGIGIGGLKAGVGCGVGIGYGWGAGFFVEPSALKDIQQKISSFAAPLLQKAVEGGERHGIALPSGLKTAAETAAQYASGSASSDTSAGAPFAGRQAHWQHSQSEALDSGGPSGRSQAGGLSSSRSSEDETSVLRAVLRQQERTEDLERRLEVLQTDHARLREAVCSLSQPLPPGLDEVCSRASSSASVRDEGGRRH